MHSPMLVECLFLFALFFCPCSCNCTVHTGHNSATVRSSIGVCVCVCVGVSDGRCIIFHCCTFSTDMRLCRYNN